MRFGYEGVRPSEGGVIHLVTNEDRYSRSGESSRLSTGIGTSDHDDSRVAGTAAARAALDMLGDRGPELVFVYASTSHDLPAALAAINETTGGAPLVGATTSGQLHAGELTPVGRGLSVLMLAGGDYRFGVSCATGAGADALETGRTLARSAREAAGPQQSRYESLVVLSDALIGDPEGLLAGIYRVTGFAVPVVGGAAGDDRLMNRTYVFCGERVLTDAAVAVWIGSDRPLKVVAGHGWVPTSLPMMVTSADGNIVREIAGRPAVEVYRENFRSDTQDAQSENEQDYYAAHAFGLIEPDGTMLIRTAFIDPEGELRTFTPLPAYAAVQVVSALPDDLLDVAAQTITAAVTDEDVAVVLVFSCVARSDILGERRPEESQRLQEAAGGVTTFGFYTYGEFARTTGVAGFHNATVAALAL